MLNYRVKTLCFLVATTLPLVSAYSKCEAEKEIWVGFRAKTANDNSFGLMKIRAKGDEIHIFDTHQWVLIPRITNGKKDWCIKSGIMEITPRVACGPDLVEYNQPSTPFKIEIHDGETKIQLMNEKKDIGSLVLKNEPLQAIFANKYSEGGNQETLVFDYGFEKTPKGLESNRHVPLMNEILQAEKAQGKSQSQIIKDHRADTLHHTMKVQYSVKQPGQRAYTPLGNLIIQQSTLVFEGRSRGALQPVLTADLTDPGQWRATQDPSHCLRLYDPSGKELEDNEKLHEDPPGDLNNLSPGIRSLKANPSNGGKH